MKFKKLLSLALVLTCMLSTTAQVYAADVDEGIYVSTEESTAPDESVTIEDEDVPLSSSSENSSANTDEESHNESSSEASTGASDNNDDASTGAGTDPANQQEDGTDASSTDNSDDGNAASSEQSDGATTDESTDGSTDESTESSTDELNDESGESSSDQEEIIEIIEPDPASQEPIVNNHGGSINVFEDVSFINLDNSSEFTKLSGDSYALVYSYDQLIGDAECSEDTKRIMFKPDITVENGDVLLLHMIAYGTDSYGKISVKVDNTSFEYVLPAQPTEYVFPIRDLSSVNTVKIRFVTDDEKICLGKLEMLTTDENSLISGTNTGMFDISGTYSSVSFDESEGMGMAASDLIMIGGYLCAANRGALTIYDINDPGNIVSVGELNGIGNVRDLVKVNDNLLLASSRENGVFLIDITDKTSPSVLSNMSTSGLATGACVSGNYCFIACRRHGIEVFDISDPTDPTLSTVIDVDAKESYDCTVSGNYLYVSMWAEKQVEIYEISNVCASANVATVDLGGCGGGLSVKNGILYVATGYNTKNSKSSFKSPEFGCGNGIDIFDVSSPSEPKWLSSTKIDGRYNYSGFDHWRVNISGNYAYLSSVYNGVYVYDISNPSNPVRKEKIVVSIPNTSSNYRNITSSNYIFPFDPNEGIQGVMSSVAFCETGVYLGANNISNGIFYRQTEFIGDEEPAASAELIAVDIEKDYNTPGFSNTLYKFAGVVNAVTTANGYYYIAAGSKGIYVADNNFDILGTIRTEGPALDVAIRGDKIYVAEGNSGMGIYSTDYTDSDNKHIYDSDYNSYVSALEIFGNDNYMLAQTGWSKLSLLKISNTNEIEKKTLSVGTMYSRCVTADKNIALNFNRKNNNLFVTNPETDTVDYYVLNKLSISENDGMTVHDGKIFATYKGGYVYLEVNDPEQIDLNTCTIHKIDGLTLQGDITVHENLMIIKSQAKRNITVLDITDLENPSLIGYYAITPASGKVYADDNEIIVPLRADGALRLVSENANTGNEDENNDPQDGDDKKRENEEEESEKASDIINLKDYGAKGDGFADDTKAVKKALLAANGKKLYVPAGTYCIGNLDLSDITVYMYSDENPMFVKIDPSKNPTLTFRNCSSGYISGISFDGSRIKFGDEVDTALVYFRGSDNVEIKNCNFYNCSREATAFLGKCSNINVHDNYFKNTSAIFWLANGTVEHARFENNVAYDGRINAVEVALNGTAKDSHDLVIRNNEFHNFMNGSVVQMRAISDVTIENNYIDNVKHFVMCTYPLDKETEEYNVSDVKVLNNKGKAKYFAYTFAYPEKVGHTYANFSFSDNEFVVTSRININDCDIAVFKNNSFDIAGDTDIRITKSDNVNFDDVKLLTEKSSKKIIYLDNCGDVTISNLSNEDNRVLLTASNVGNTKLILNKVQTNFAKLGSNITYPEEMSVECIDCVNTGNKLDAKIINDSVLALPVLGTDFTLKTANDLYISDIRKQAIAGETITLTNVGADIVFSKENARFPKGTAVELKYDGSKWIIPVVKLSIVGSGDCNVAVGGKASFKATAQGGSGSYDYRWYRSTDQGNTWVKTTMYITDDPTNISFTTTAKMYDYLFKCEVKDKKTGEKVSTSAMRCIKTSEAVTIIQEPDDCLVKVGDNAVFTVNAVGDVKKYRWYTSTDGGNTWVKTGFSGYKSNELVVTVAKYMDSRLFYCEITDSEGVVYKSRAAKLNIAK